MRGMRRKRVLTLTGAGALAIALLGAPSASANGITVTSTADPTGTAGQCTLRQALASANDDDAQAGSSCADGSGADTIFIASGLLPADIDLTAGELEVKSDVTIPGPGPGQLGIDGGGATRVFHVKSGTSTFDGLRIHDAMVTLPGPLPKGGAGV